MATQQLISPEAIAVLRTADRKIQALSFGSHHLLYEFVRLTMAQITRVDSFYVGYYCPDREMIFPYSFDSGEYDPPEKFPYAQDGLAAWMRANKRPYRYSDDEGKLFHRGKQYGDMSRISHDSVAVPLLEPLGNGQTRAMGILSIQSYASCAYDEATVQAFQWIAESMATALLRERDDEIRRRSLYSDEQIGGSRPRPIVAIVEEICERLKIMRNRVEVVSRLVPEESCALLAAVDDLGHECEQNQTETIELLLRSVLVAENALPVLTNKQKEILDLMVQGLSNKQIGNRLFISEQTVKTHVSAIISQFGVTGRSGVIEMVKHILY